MYVQRNKYNKRLKQCTHFGEDIIYDSYKYIGKIPIKNTNKATVIKFIFEAIQNIRSRVLFDQKHSCNALQFW